MSASTSNLLPDALDEVEMLIEVDENVDSTAQCHFRLTATHAVDDTVEILDVLDFTVEVDEAVNFSPIGPLAAVDIVPSVGGEWKFVFPTTAATRPPFSSTWRTPRA